MSDDQDRELSIDIDLDQPPINVGSSVADALLPLITDVSGGLDSRARVEYWHGLMAAITAAQMAHIGIQAAEGILKCCTEYGRTIEEERVARGLH